jgi:hypothetical protein
VVFDFPMRPRRGAGVYFNIGKQLAVGPGFDEVPRRFGKALREFGSMAAENDVTVREQAEEVGRELPAEDFRFAVPERNGYHPIRAFPLPKLIYRVVDAGADLPCVIANNERPGFVLPCIAHEINMIFFGHESL